MIGTISRFLESQYSLKTLEIEILPERSLFIEGEEFVKLWESVKNCRKIEILGFRLGTGNRILEKEDAMGIALLGLNNLKELKVEFEGLYFNEARLAGMMGVLEEKVLFRFLKLVLLGFENGRVMSKVQMWKRSFRKRRIEFISNF